MIHLLETLVIVCGLFALVLLAAAGAIRCAEWVFERVER